MGGAACNASSQDLRLETVDRNRLNQRNFRARRQAYVHELEQRLKTLEEAGVCATREVQFAAQRVAHQNQLLKSLLETRFGVSRSQIDEYLQQAGLSATAGAPGFPAQADTDISRADLITPLPCFESTVRMKGVLAETSKCNPIAEISAHAENHNVQGLERFSQPVESAYDSDGSATVAAQSEPHSLTIEKRPAITHKTHSFNHFGAQFNGQSEQQLDKSLSHAAGIPIQGRCGASSEGSNASLGETQCEDAAVILAGLRGQDAQDQQARRDLWRELGCGPTGPCRVSNLSIFELMDRERALPLNL
jgi:hypothetical protein